MTTISNEEIKETVKQVYSARWSKEAQCCQSDEVEIFQASCQSCETAQQDKVIHEVHKRLIKELAPKEGMKILDVGSGSGRTVLYIAEKVVSTGKAVGVDVSNLAISLAKKRAKQAGLEGIAEIKLGDAENLPFNDEIFDAVISECVISLVPDKQKALKEKVRVLKPGGRVIMHDVIRWMEIPAVVKSDPSLYCSCIGGAVTIASYKDMMTKAGLENIKMIDYTKEEQAGLNSIALSAAANIKNSDQYKQMADFIHKGGIGYVLLIGTKSRQKNKKVRIKSVPTFQMSKSHQPNPYPLSFIWARKPTSIL